MFHDNNNSFRSDWWKCTKNTNSTFGSFNYNPYGKIQTCYATKTHSTFTYELKRASHILIIFHTVSFPHLVQEYGIRSCQLLEYLQLKSSVQSKNNIRATNNVHWWATHSHHHIQLHQQHIAFFFS